MPRYIFFLGESALTLTFRNAMKLTFFVAILLIPLTSVFAEDWRDPDSLFDARKKMSDTIKLTWRTVDNVQKACEDESRSRGNNGFGYSIQACSFWNGTECTIITRNRASLHNLGHEVRHCFQGNFHGSGPTPYSLNKGQVPSRSSNQAD